MRTIDHVIRALHAIAPPKLAEAWDNVGLLLGDPRAPCDRVLVALETDLALVRRAARQHAQLLITHHPPIFTPVPRVTADEPAGKVLLAAARAGLALAAAHTNYDVAPGGVSDVLADLLDLRGVEPLAPADASDAAKIVVFTPPGDLEAVLRALAGAGAGAVGRYSDCSFRVPGTGTFRAMDGAHPTVGRPGRREEVGELRVEALVPRALAAGAAAAARAAHSYEEPAIDVYPLVPTTPELGMGRCGDLPEPARAAHLVERIKERLGVATVRVAGRLSRRVERVAVCGGSGGKLAADALRRGCQLYLTGDVSHHEALDAAAGGLVVVDAGHAATEAPAIPVLARRLAQACPTVRITAMRAKPAGPFCTV